MYPPPLGPSSHTRATVQSEGSFRISVIASTKRVESSAERETPGNSKSGSEIPARLKRRVSSLKTSSRYTPPLSQNQILVGRRSYPPTAVKLHRGRALVCSWIMGRQPAGPVKPQPLPVIGIFTPPERNHFTTGKTLAGRAGLDQVEAIDTRIELSEESMSHSQSPQAQPSRYAPTRRPLLSTALSCRQCQNRPEHWPSEVSEG